MNIGRIVGLGVLLSLMGLSSAALADLVAPSGGSTGTAGSVGAGGLTAGSTGGGTTTAAGATSVAGAANQEDDDSDDGGCTMVPSSPSSPWILAALGLAIGATVLRRKRG